LEEVVSWLVSQGFVRPVTPEGGRKLRQITRSPNGWRFARAEITPLWSQAG
jgi:hypothetical protein